MLEKHVHENLKIGIHFYSTLLLDCGSLAGKVFTGLTLERPVWLATFLLIGFGIYP